MWQPRLRYACLLITFTLALVQPAWADYRVTISVEGLACPFCTYGIEKRLKKLDFVQDIKSSLKDGKVTFRVTEGKTPDLDKVKAAVKRAGFTARDILLTAIGTLNFKDDKIWLALRRSKEKLSLADSASTLTPEIRKRLSELAKAGVVAAITGRPSDKKNAPSKLSVLRAEQVYSVGFQIKGKKCVKCVRRLTRSLKTTKGDYTASVDFGKSTVTVESIGQKPDVTVLRKLIVKAGFKLGDSN